MTLEEELAQATPAVLARVLALAAARLIELSTTGGERDAGTVVSTLTLPALTSDDCGPGVPAPMNGEELKDLRIIHQFTMAQTAKLLGVAERTIWRWEHSVTEINPLTVPVIRRKLADAARLRNDQA